MGKLSGIIVTLVFVGAIALLVYFCFRAKQKRNMGLGGNRWSDVFFRQSDPPHCNGNQIQNQTQPCSGAIGYPAQQHPAVPHSIVNPYAQPYPGAGQPGGGYPYPQNTPYPLGHPPNMPMPGSHFEHVQHVQSGPTAPFNPYPYPPNQPYPQPGPDELPPPYSAVVASEPYRGQRY